MNTQTHLNGCHNRAPFRRANIVQDGWRPNGNRNTITIANHMARDCQYTHTELGKLDKGCDGCKWKQTN